MPLTKGESSSGDETKENDGDRCNTPTRAPPREQWRAAPELDELKEVIGTRAQVLAAIKLQARCHAPHGAQLCMAALAAPVWARRSPDPCDARRGCTSRATRRPRPPPRRGKPSARAAVPARPQERSPRHLRPLPRRGGRGGCTTPTTCRAVAAAVRPSARARGGPTCASPFP